MPTRQTSSSGRPKSPRIQVVLPEELCDRLAVLADLEARTVSNMARVLIQQGVERLEHLHGLEPNESPVEPSKQLPQPVRPSSLGTTRGERSRTANPDAEQPGSGTSRGSAGGQRSSRGSARDERFGAGSGGASPSRGPRASGGARRGASSSERRISGDGFRGDPFRSDASQADAFAADAFRAELERQGQTPSPPIQKPRRLRIWRPS